MRFIFLVITFNLIVISDVACQINYIFNKCTIQTKDVYSGIVDTVYSTPLNTRKGIEYGIDFCAAIIDTSNNNILLDFHSRINPELNFKIQEYYTHHKWAAYGVKEYHMKDGSLIRWDGTYLSYRTTNKDKKYIFNKYGTLTDQPPRIK